MVVALIPIGSIYFVYRKDGDDDDDYFLLYQLL